MGVSKLGSGNSVDVSQMGVRHLLLEPSSSASESLHWQEAGIRSQSWRLTLEWNVDVLTGLFTARLNEAKHFFFDEWWQLSNDVIQGPFCYHGCSFI